MIRMMKTVATALIVAGVSVAGAAVGGANAGAGDFDPLAPKVLSEKARVFANINPAVKMASAYGDKSHGVHGTFGQFPAKFETPYHTHSAAYHGVVIKGVMTNPFKGDANSPKMGPGSYWYVPASAVHATACVSDTPCEFYFHSKSSFDFHPAE